VVLVALVALAATGDASASGDRQHRDRGDRGTPPARRDRPPEHRRARARRRTGAVLVLGLAAASAISPFAREYAKPKLAGPLVVLSNVICTWWKLPPFSVPAATCWLVKPGLRVSPVGRSEHGRAASNASAPPADARTSSTSKLPTASAPVWSWDARPTAEPWASPARSGTPSYQMPDPSLAEVGRDPVAARVISLPPAGRSGASWPPSSVCARSWSARSPPPSRASRDGLRAATVRVETFRDPEMDRVAITAGQILVNPYEGTISLRIANRARITRRTTNSRKATRSHCFAAHRELLS
jgi:hypothetical protein